VLTSPQIVVTKVCTPPRRGLLRPGNLLHYSGTVSNAGNTTLINVTVVNNQPGGGSLLLGPLALAPGESIPYIASYIVPPDFCGDDTVTASGLDVCAYGPVVNSVTATCPVAPYSPRIAVSKHCPERPTPHGGTLTYSGTVSNAGNVTLVNVFVVDNQPSNSTPVIGPITLAPGAFTNFTGSYTAPPVCCEVIDTLTARGQDRCSGSNVTATATAVCPLLYTPGIAVVQSCPPNGTPYMFSGFVTNTGDAMMTNVVVSSSQAGQQLTLLGPLDLAPGQSEPYTGSYTNLQVQDMITVVGVSTCGVAVSNTVSTIRCVRGMQITQSYPSNSFSVSFATENGKSYTVEYRNGLSDPTWKNMPNMPVPGTGGIVTITDSTAAQQPSRFYRVIATP